MTQRIDVSSAKFPTPTAALFDAMGKEAYLAMAEFHKSMGHDPLAFPEWNDQSQPLRDSWAVAARAMYAAMARFGGGKITKVDYERTVDNFDEARWPA